MTMVAAGHFRDPAKFQRLSDTEAHDQYGQPTDVWETLDTVRGDLRETPGREALAAGRMEGTKTGTLRVRYSTMMAQVKPFDRVVIRGETWNIRSLPAQVGRTREVLEFRVETGGPV